MIRRQYTPGCLIFREIKRYSNRKREVRRSPRRSPDTHVYAYSLSFPFSRVTVAVKCGDLRVLSDGSSDIVGETEIPDKFEQSNVRNNSAAPIGVNNQIMYPVPS